MISIEKSVGAVIFRVEKGKIQYLLTKYVSGHWDFVKGHVEAGESEEDTLRREALEEAGLTTLKVLPKFRHRIQYFYMAKGSEKKKRKNQGRGIWIFKRVYYYLAQTPEKKIRIPQTSYEQVSYGWFSYEHALKQATHKNAQILLKKADEYLQKNPDSIL